jgi:hypothetical protein
MINPKKLISELTVEEYISLSRTTPKRYEYGIKGIAKIFGCSKDKAWKIKNSGIISEAIYQNGNIIVIDIDKALELFREDKKPENKVNK